MQHLTSTSASKQPRHATLHSLCPSCWPKGLACQKWARSVKSWERQKGHKHTYIHTYIHTRTALYIERRPANLTRFAGCLPTSRLLDTCFVLNNQHKADLPLEADLALHTRHVLRVFHAICARIGSILFLPFELADPDTIDSLSSPQLSDSSGPLGYGSSHSLACLVFQLDSYWFLLSPSIRR